MYGPGHIWTLSAAETLLDVYIGQKRWAEAKELAVPTLQLLEENIGTEDSETQECRQRLVDIYAGLNDWPNAEQLALQALSIASNKLGPHDWDTLVMKHDLSEVYANWNNIQKAEELENEILEDCLNTFGPDHGYTLFFSALVLKRRGEETEAIQQMVRSIKRLEYSLGPYFNPTKSATYLLQVWCGDDEAVNKLLGD
nr:hypothetical protein ANI_1_202184 [Aspergillus niger CBS 513.88]|eukprot:XP_003188651.1 hypothetical protein ANI_1_202184 [Aspergillus niger CBS 513.88]